MTYIALLRGVNVGSHTIKMEHLRQLFVELGFGDVRSYIQTGNVFFDSDEVDERLLAATIEEYLRQMLGYSVPVFLRSAQELEQIITANPFKDIAITPDIRLCILFTAGPLPVDLTLPASSLKGDLEIVGVTRREAFIVWHLINGRPPSSQSFLTKILGQDGTTRFFHTATKILAASAKR